MKSSSSKKLGSSEMMAEQQHTIGDIQPLSESVSSERHMMPSVVHEMAVPCVCLELAIVTLCSSTPYPTGCGCPHYKLQIWLKFVLAVEANYVYQFS